MLTLEINPEFTIHSLLTENNLEHFEGLKVSDMYNGFCLYDFVTHIPDYADVAVCICLKEGKFNFAKLSLWDPAIYGTNWSEWAEEKEKLRAKNTQKWLSSKGFNVGNYEWGYVWSGYDSKSAHGFALIQHEED